MGFLSVGVFVSWQPRRVTTAGSSPCLIWQGYTPGALINAPSKVSAILRWNRTSNLSIAATHLQ